METRINIATSNGYILDNGKLTAYEFKSAKVDFATGMVEYDCILGGKPTTFKAEECPKVYKDESAFQQGRQQTPASYSWAELINDTIGSAPYELNDDEEFASAYCLADGEIVATPFPKNGFVVRSGGHRSYVGDGKYYSSRDEAILYCDIVKVESDGTEVTIPSPASLVALDEEQREAVKAVEDALRRASELGVAFGFDISEEEMFAFSDNHIESFGWDYDGRLTSALGHCINNLVTSMGGVRFWAFSRCETQLYAKFKEE